MNTPRKNSSYPLNSLAMNVALIAILAALAIGGNYALSAIPNVELSSVMVFLSGFLFGPLIGILTGLIAMTIYQLWNPWGAFLPPIGFAVIGCTMFIGLVGGILGRNFQLSATRGKIPLRWYLWPAFFGVTITLFYDLVTNLVYSITFGIPFVIAFITGLPFMVLHMVTNSFLFGLLTPVISRIAMQLNIVHLQFMIHESAKNNNEG
ncbi:MAG: ECF transporter S component [Candidatus Hodarchaeota archaeon]